MYRSFLAFGKPTEDRKRKTSRSSSLLMRKFTSSAREYVLQKAVRRKLQHEQPSTAHLDHAPHDQAHCLPALPNWANHDDPGSEERPGDADADPCGETAHAEDRLGEE